MESEDLGKLLVIDEEEGAPHGHDNPTSFS